VTHPALVRTPLWLVVVGAAGLTAPARGQSYTLAQEFAYVFPGWTNPAEALPRGKAGDWNGDGSTDFAILQRGPNSGAPSRFRIHSGFDYSLIAEWVGAMLPGVPSVAEQPGMGAGFADVTGDGALDLLLGTRETPFMGMTAVGRVVAFENPTAQTLYTVWGEGQADNFGQSVTVVGDTSGNGVVDYLVLAPTAGPGLSNAGVVYLIEGSDGSVRYSFLATNPTEFNASRSALGDLDGDGLADFALGHSGSSAPSGVGTVTLHSGFSATTVIRQHVGATAAYGSAALFSVGDTDGDGLGEYLISDELWPTGLQFAPGAAWMYSGATGALVTTLQPPPTALSLGGGGARLDDLDQDGASEVVLSAWSGFSQLIVFSSLTGTVLQAIPNPWNYYGPSYFGRPLEAIGDIDGEGHVDFAAAGGNGPALVYTYDLVTVTPSTVPIGGTATFQFSAVAQPGVPYHLCLSASATAGIPLGTRVFPLDLDPILLMTLENPYLGGTLDATGSATVQIPVPPQPALAGSYRFAGFTLSPAAPFGVRTIGTAGWISVQ
jgi:hypothetical protein